jgi:hypothetical protein
VESILQAGRGGGGASGTSSRHEFWQRLIMWLKENFSTLILNFGSVASLIGFTRSDVLELRGLSVTGSLCAVVYHVTIQPFRITPILWSLTFAAVNSFKIFQIMQERKGSVNLTEQEEEMYMYAQQPLLFFCYFHVDLLQLVFSKSVAAYIPFVFIWRSYTKIAETSLCHMAWCVTIRTSIVLAFLFLLPANECFFASYLLC